MKCIAIDCHGAYGSSSVDARPYGGCREALFCWHFGPLLTKSMILSFIFGHQKFCQINSMVLSCPICPATFVSCSDSITHYTMPFRTHSKFLHYRSPFFSSTSLAFRSFGASASGSASFFAFRYAASFSFLLQISSRNVFDHFLSGSEVSRTEEQVNVVPLLLLRLS